MLYSKTPALEIDGNTIDSLVHFIHTDDDHSVVLNEIALISKDGKLSVAHHRTHTASDQITCMSSSFEYCEGNIAEYILLQHRSGEIYQYEIHEDQISTFPLYKRSQYFVQFYEIESEGMKLTVGLTQNQKLLLEDKVLSSECTSVFIYGNFILFTAFSNGLSHILYIYNIHEQNFRQFLVSMRKYQFLIELKTL